jgi:hypothetical protein
LVHGKADTRRTETPAATRAAQFKQLSMLLDPKERMKLADQFQVKFDDDDESAEEAPPAAAAGIGGEELNGLSSTDGLSQHANWRSAGSVAASSAAAGGSVEEGRGDQQLADFFKSAQPQLREIIADVSSAAYRTP